MSRWEKLDLLPLPADVDDVVTVVCPRCDGDCVQRSPGQTRHAAKLEAICKLCNGTGSIPADEADALRSEAT